MGICERAASVPKQALRIGYGIPGKHILRTIRLRTINCDLKAIHAEL